MIFKRTKNFNIYLSEKDRSQLSSHAKITAALKSKNVIAFDIYTDYVLIGFAMFCKFDQNGYFLWNFAIDSRYQNKHFGTKALRELLFLMKNEYSAKIVTTTYLWGNIHAKHVYERNGFIETDVVNEEGIYEVNMKVNL